MRLLVFGLSGFSSLRYYYCDENSDLSTGRVRLAFLLCGRYHSGTVTRIVGLATFHLSSLERIHWALLTPFRYSDCSVVELACFASKT